MTTYRRVGSRRITYPALTANRCFAGTRIAALSRRPLPSSFPPGQARSLSDIMPGRTEAKITVQRRPGSFLTCSRRCILGALRRPRCDRVSFPSGWEAGSTLANYQPQVVEPHKGIVAQDKWETVRTHALARDGDVLRRSFTGLPGDILSLAARAPTPPAYEQAKVWFTILCTGAILGGAALCLLVGWAVGRWLHRKAPGALETCRRGAFCRCLCCRHFDVSFIRCRDLPKPENRLGGYRECPRRTGKPGLPRNGQQCAFGKHGFRCCRPAGRIRFDMRRALGLSVSGYRLISKSTSSARGAAVAYGPFRDSAVLQSIHRPSIIRSCRAFREYMCRVIITRSEI